MPQILQLLFKFGQQAFCRRLFAFGKCLHINYMRCRFTVATQMTYCGCQAHPSKLNQTKGDSL